MLYWIIKNLFLAPYLNATFRPWVSGIENVPVRGPVILASNHVSVVDSLFLPLMLRRKVTFLAKSDYFTGRGVKGFAIRTFMEGVGQLSIDRSGGAASEASLNAGVGVLRSGGVLGIYPEGTRSPSGKLYRGRTGVARMVLEAKVPVVPVAMFDTDKSMPIGKVIPRVRRIGVVIGEPLDFSRFDGLEGDRFVLRSITDEIMVEIARLSGQEYVDVYASTLRQPAAGAA
ncbi:lysophospholipid acyltransferase family protein [uncultured Amnibacterium sp.]|uniref:lysophospholipid acyltransferase family protein n=1 Tax=uncultured Amnibacterium sp. TaxID=1631851 RepID=UPI0035CBA126